jgi:hypothetical protein
LAHEVEDTRTEFQGRFVSEGGDYLRPLDTGNVNSLDLSAFGWRPLGNSGSVVGGVQVERASLAGGAPANVADPYAMTPHIFADTSATDLGRTLARLEGAGGWNVKGWGLGVALGHASWDTRTDVSLVPRFQRGSRSGVSLGVSRPIVPGRFAVGTHARWLSNVQMLSLSTREATTRIYIFEGYGEPVASDLAPRQGYSRRIEREGGAAGITGAATFAGLNVALFGEATRIMERQAHESSNDPPTDRWDATGRTLGLAAESRPRDGRTRMHARVTWTRVSGEAGRAGLEDEGRLFEATEEVVEAALDYAFRPNADWSVGAHLGVYRDDRFRRDLLARVRSSIRTVRPTVALEARRAVGTSVAVGLGVGVGWSTPTGGIPNPDLRGDLYRVLIGPELAYYATPSRSNAAFFTLQWRRSAGDVLAVAVQYDRAAPRAASVRLPLAPDGNRTTWDVAVRWVPAIPMIAR